MNQPKQRGVRITASPYKGNIGYIHVEESYEPEEEDEVLGRFYSDSDLSALIEEAERAAFEAGREGLLFTGISIDCNPPILPMEGAPDFVTFDDWLAARKAREG